MGKFRKKPIIVEAEIYKPGMEDGFSCTMESMCTEKCKTCEFKMPYIETLEGKLYISSGDYIVTGVKGERYPCKPDIFEMTYEKIETSGKTEESKTANKFQCAKWIRTSEELPEINEKVIIRTQHTITIAYLRESDFYDEPMYFQDELSGNWDIEEVTHWMPLPEPPKDVEYER